MAYTLPLSTQLEAAAMKEDKKHCRRFGPCGVGKKALYLNSFYLDRRYYVPFSSITRVFKRVAMSRGGFSGKGIFASLSYLVVVYDGGKEKQCLFKKEEQVDEMIEYIRASHPELRYQSVEVEKKLAERAAREAARVKPVISPEAAGEAKKLRQALDFLEKRPSLGTALSRCARAKRVNERSNPMYRWVALIFVIMGAIACGYGVYALITRADFGIYFTLFGLAVVFLFAGAGVLPTKKNNQAYIQQEWENACQAASSYISRYPDFPVPACYAHPVTLTRMIRAIEDAKASTALEALDYVKKDLQHLNADVQVEQEEYDEIMAIKPMFLVENYR